MNEENIEKRAEKLINDNKILGLSDVTEVLQELLTKNKEIEEENRIFALEGSRVSLKIHIEKNYIPVSLVKEKIEELDKEEKRELKGTKGQDRYYIKQKYMYKRNTLQELLEKRK